MPFRSTCQATPGCAARTKSIAEQKKLVRFSNDQPSRAFGDRRTSSRLSDADHNIATPRRRMHPAAKLQFERTVREFAQWRAVPEADRSPAPAWWWQPAMEVVAQHEGMGALMCYRLQLPVGSTYAAGAAALMATLADQASLPWPDEFPRKIRRDGDAQVPSL